MWIALGILIGICIFALGTAFGFLIGAFFKGAKDEEYGY